MTADLPARDRGGCGPHLHRLVLVLHRSGPDDACERIVAAVADSRPRLSICDSARSVRLLTAGLDIFRAEEDAVFSAGTSRLRLASASTTPARAMPRKACYTTQFGSERFARPARRCAGSKSRLAFRARSWDVVERAREPNCVVQQAYCAPPLRAPASSTLSQDARSSKSAAEAGCRRICAEDRPARLSGAAPDPVRFARSTDRAAVSIAPQSGSPVPSGPPNTLDSTSVGETAADAGRSRRRSSAGRSLVPVRPSSVTRRSTRRRHLRV